MRACNAGVVKLPIDGWQDNGLLGLVEGIAKGAAGLLLKPPSGILECFSKTISGLAIGIRTWGDEAVRLPRTRIRSPRHFAAFADDSGVACMLAACRPTELPPW